METNKAIGFKGAAVRRNISNFIPYNVAFPATINGITASLLH